MLIQSGEGSVLLLPALPDDWESGELTGAKLRGGYTADMSWEKGRLSRLELAGLYPGKIKLIYGNKSLDLTFKKQGEIKEIRTEDF